MIVFAVVLAVVVLGGLGYLSTVLGRRRTAFTHGQGPAATGEPPLFSWARSGAPSSPAARDRAREGA